MVLNVRRFYDRRIQMFLVQNIMGSDKSFGAAHHFVLCTGDIVVLLDVE
jgi:hypothetical protein